MFGKEVESIGISRYEWPQKGAFLRALSFSAGLKETWKKSQQQNTKHPPSPTQRPGDRDNCETSELQVRLSHFLISILFFGESNVCKC